MTARRWPGTQRHPRRTAATEPRGRPCAPPYAPQAVPYAVARAQLVAGRQGPGHVLGVDQAKRSGWALVDLESKRCVLSGATSRESDEADAIALLTRLPGLDWGSVLVVLEDHSTFPIRSGETSATVLLSLGESRQRWKTLLSQAGQPPEARVLATPDAWRKLLGTRGNVGRASWKAQALLWSSALTKRRIEDDNEAEAVVIAMWGAHEGLVRWASVRAEAGAAKRPRPRKGEEA